MTTKKKKQHYVWRKYLRAWSEKDKIWTFHKKKDKVFQSGLMGVGVQNYFYRLIDFNQIEEQFLKEFIIHSSNPSVKDLNIDFLNLFTSHSKLKKSLFESNLKEEDEKDFNSRIELLEINLMEDVHTKFEHLGSKILDVENENYPYFLNNQDDYFETILFLCIQYFRTKKMKENVENSFIEEKRFDFLKFWNIISFSMATNVARNISLDPKSTFLFYENKTGIDFITSDQPIFNIADDNLDENGNVTDLEFYYPISSKLALLIHFRNKTEKIEFAQINRELVKFFNSEVAKNANEFIFSNDSKPLIAIKNST